MPKRRKLVPRRAADTIRVASLDSGQHERTARRMASLQVVQGADVDLGRHLLCDRPITIGRDAAVELALNDGSISRKHCRVERDGESGRYVLIDLGSTNGTTVNGTRIGNVVPLAEGDKIFLGASVVRFSYADALDLEFQSRLEDMVTTDPLTGMATTREYDAIYAAILERAAAEGSPVALLVMDMDGLKQINDTYGHEMGGYTIAQVSLIIRDVLEPYGELCRFGGDEFVACLPSVDRPLALRLAEQVRDNGVRLSPTLSIGVATYPHDAADGPGLFSAADGALYRAKRAGRNQVAT
jgi:diguanylate cyclase (GGDEF)-like protein